MRAWVLMLALVGLSASAGRSQDAAQDAPAFVEVVSPRTRYFAGEPFEVRLRIGFDRFLVSPNLLQSSAQSLDIPVDVDAPWLLSLPGTVAVDAAAAPGAARKTGSLAVNGRRAEATQIEETLIERPFTVVVLASSFVAASPGPLVVPGPTLRYSYATKFRDDLINGRVPVDRKDVTLRGKDLALTILPVPEEGRPSGFSGAVGRFTVQAGVASPEVAEGQSLRLSLVIEGPGNLTTFDPPRNLGIAGFRVQGILDAKDRRRRTITYDLVPVGDAPKEVPPIAFAYFDPTPPAQYRVATTEAIPVSVKRGAASRAENVDAMPPPPRFIPGTNDLFGLKDSGVALAERAYAAGRYADASARFEAALDDPAAQKGALFYDLGNCAFRAGRPADAVLAFRRAARELPRDREVLFNLRFAEQHLGVEGEAHGAISRLAGTFTNGELGIIASILGAAGVLGLLLRRGRPWRIAMVCVLVAGLSTLALALRGTIWPGARPAVVLVEDLGLRDDPHTESAAHVRLRAGESVHVEESSDRWAYVRHARGSGWVERAAIGIVE